VSKRKKGRAKTSRKEPPAKPPEPGRTAPRREWLVLGGIVLVGLMLRVSYLREIVDAPDFEYPLVDAQFHDYWARGLATGEWSPPRDVTDPEIQRRPYFRPPGYPTFLALVYKLSGGSYLAARIVQVALGLVCVVLAHLLGRRIFGPAVGLIFAGFMAVYWSFIYFEGELLAPVLLVLLGLCLMMTLTRWTAGFTYPRTIVGGLLVGLFALIRPNILLFVPVVLIWAWWMARRRKDGRRFRVVLLGFLPAAAVVIAPATIRNYRVANDFVLITSNAGVNLYIGNNEKTDCVWPSIPILEDLAGLQGWTCFDYPNIVRGVEQKVGRPLKDSEVSSYFTQRALEYMRSHPGRVLGLMLKKAALYWGPAEISNNKVIQVEREHSKTLRYMPGFPFVLSLAVAGVVLLGVQFRSERAAKEDEGGGRDRFESVVLILLFALTYCASFLPFFVAGRYRVPITPFLLLLGAYGVYRFGQVAARRNLRLALIAAIIWVGSYALARTPFVAYEPDVGRWHYDRGTACLNTGKMDLALEEYLESVRLDPDDHVTRVNLGLLLGGQGRSVEAIEHFAAAVRIKPDLALAHRNLGRLLASVRRFEEATPSLRRAVELAPQYKNAWVSLGDALRDQGQMDEAVGAYRMALQLEPHQHDALLYQRIGDTVGARGRADEAKQAYQEGVRLDPGLVEVRLALGQLCIGQGLDAEAEGHLRAAVRAAPGYAQAHARLGMVLAKQGKLDEAVGSYRAAIQINPDHLGARYNLGQALEQLGRREEALQEYRQVLRIKPGHPGAVQALSALEGCGGS